MARKDWLETRPEPASLMQKALQENDLWRASHIAQATEILYKNIPDSVSRQHLLSALNARSWDYARG
jgi:ABC-type nitrate/sulfonate/bicarbonate transport system substrate-binding protein